MFGQKTIGKVTLMQLKQLTDAAEAALEACVHPEQLKKALETEPIFAEDLIK